MPCPGWTGVASCSMWKMVRKTYIMLDTCGILGNIYIVVQFCVASMYVVVVSGMDFPDMTGK